MTPVLPALPRIHGLKLEHPLLLLTPAERERLAAVLLELRANRRRGEANVSGTVLP